VAKACNDLDDAGSPNVSSEPFLALSNDAAKQPTKPPSSEVALPPEEADRLNRDVASTSFVHVETLENRTLNMSLLWMQQGPSSVRDRPEFFDTPPKASSPILIPTLPSPQVVDLLRSVYLVNFNTTSPIFHEDDLREQVMRACDSPTEATECDFFIVLSEFGPLLRCGETYPNISSSGLRYRYLYPFARPEPRLRAPTSFRRALYCCATLCQLHVYRTERTQSVCKECFFLPIIFFSIQSVAVSSIEAYIITEGLMLTVKSRCLVSGRVRAAHVRRFWFAPRGADMSRVRSTPTRHEAASLLGLVHCRSVIEWNVGPSAEIIRHVDHMQCRCSFGNITPAVAEAFFG
jgi:hypothetical protein